VRTTLSIDDDVLEAVKERAKREGRTAGEVLSELARRAMTDIDERPRAATRNGLPVLPSRGTLVSNSLVDRLRNEEHV